MSDSKPGRHDLKWPMSQSVIKNQSPPSGESIILEVDGILHNYYYDGDAFIADRLSKRLRSEQGWFEKLVRHAPSVGSFYEDALRSIIKEILPSSLRIGTGFIFDEQRRVCSKQLDIVIYDDTKMAPLYRSGEFVVISPKMNVAASEVKKTLMARDIKNVIRTTIGSNFGGKHGGFQGVNFLSTFCYQSTLSTKRIFELVVQEISLFITSLANETESGFAVTMGLQNLVLPRFYFFDRGEYIEASLQKGDGMKAKIVVGQYPSPTSDGLSEFLGNMSGANDISSWESRNFINFHLRNVDREHVIEDPIFVFQRISLARLSAIFPREIDLIRKFRTSKGRPVEVRVPAQVDIDSIGSFREFVKIPNLLWVSFDDATL